ncbi:GMP synthase [Maritimibacter sp. DP07]|uniref:GMP synthase n=1 Tax=Maritimibacter harenae TaxID=2606218 RepID=A0A845LZR6_9RHOB|nr:VIT1/CCC1 transporter family protein [Maritimibacter harenae]MZR13285.1 GMP synthase [Maritimibacter harenae]
MARRGALARIFLRQLTYGGNDGIVTTFAIVAGFAGAEAQGTAGIASVAVLVFGVANLIADAASMGLGEFLSDRSTRALYRDRTAKLRDEGPAVAERELVATLTAQGLDTETAQRAAAAIATDPHLAADVTLRYSAEAEAPGAARPLLRGTVTFSSFVVFGLIPIIPFFVAPDHPSTFMVSAVATLAALTLLGALRWRTTHEHALRAIGETVILGGFCAALAYGAGNVMAGFGGG